MYQTNDTIVAVSSANDEGRVIIRITGMACIEEAGRIFYPVIRRKKAGIFSGFVAVSDNLKLDAKVYLFLSPHSYAGDDLVEIHIFTNPSVTEAVIYQLMKGSVRMAGPGEFTARSYLNGKIDLAQAEAVNQIIVSSNSLQLAAAEKLLSGRLSQTVKKVCSELIDYLTQIETRLDFSQEDIEFAGKKTIAAGLKRISNELSSLLSNSVTYEMVMNLPSVGVAGAPGAGKSRLVNTLLGKNRCIVSTPPKANISSLENTLGPRKTTRDVLREQLILENYSCILFDCASLVAETENIIDKLSQAAAIEALGNSDLVIFCVDITKSSTQLCEDKVVKQLFNPKNIIALATKSDLLPDSEIQKQLSMLKKTFGLSFLAASSKTGSGINELKQEINRVLTDHIAQPEIFSDTAGLTARHKHSINEAIDNIRQAVIELDAGNDEVAAMLLRSAYKGLSDIEQQPIDEKILDNIFRNFCIGK